MTAPLSPAELADLRRFCGYPIIGAPLDPAYAGGGAQIDAIGASLSDAVLTILRTVYLVPLSEMEAGLAGAACDLDIKKAAVYERNLNELAERDALFYAWRLRLCSFLGVPAGASVAPSVGLGGSATVVPAIFAV